jgi:ABC-type multidrug transport system permease subunit
MSWFPVARALAHRSLLETARVPVPFVMLAIMPVFFVVFFSGAFDGLTDLPTFPTQSSVSWVLAFGIVQGAAFSGMAAGLGAARDLQNGFFDRLLLAPGSRTPILVGAILAGWVRALLACGLVLVVGLLMGAELSGGVVGIALILLTALGVGAIALGWTLGIVYRSADMRSIFALIQIGIFFPTFLSTGQVPLSEQTGWVHAVARVNPITNILELTRQPMLGEVTWSSTWPGLLALAGGALVLWAFAVRGLRRLIP